MEFEKLLMHVKKQRDGVQKVMDQQRYKREKEPYRQQLVGLDRKIQLMEEQLKWVTTFRNMGHSEEEILILIGRRKK